MQLFNKNKIPFELSSSGPTQYGYISKDGDSYSIEYCEKIEMPKDEGIIRIIREDSAYFPSFNAVLEFPVNMNIYPSFVPFYTGYDLKDTLKEVFDYAQDVNNTHIFIINTDDGDKKHLVIPLQTLYEEDYDLFTVEGDILPEDMLVVEANGYSFRGKYFLADGTMIFEANGATLDIVGKDALYKKYTYEIFSRLNPGECLGFRAFDGGYKLYGASVDEDGVVLRDLHENFKSAFLPRKKRRTTTLCYLQ